MAMSARCRSNIRPEEFVAKLGEGGALQGGSDHSRGEGSGFRNPAVSHVAVQGCIDTLALHAVQNIG